MPMPVSTTRRAMAEPYGRTDGGSSDGEVGSIRSSTLPVSVNFTALDSRLRSTWRSRESSVSRSDGTPGALVMRNSRLFCVVIGWKVAST